MTATAAKATGIGKLGKKRVHGASACKDRAAA